MQIAQGYLIFFCITQPTLQMLTTWKLSYKCNGVSWDSGPTCPHDNVPTYPKGAILKLSVVSLLYFKI